MVWAVANSNLALVKYWGKADEGAKHPAAASLSLTLDSLSTVARVEFSNRLESDRVEGLPGFSRSDIEATHRDRILDEWRLNRVREGAARPDLGERRTPLPLGHDPRSA